MRLRQPAALALALPALTVSLLAAGCGGGTQPSGVASVATTSSTPATTTQSGPAVAAAPPSSGSDGSAHQGFQISMKVGNTADGAKFSACMRKHGVPNYPDPNGQGVITIKSGMGIDPNSPAFQSAQTTCRKLLPNGGKPTPAQQAQQQQKLLAFSKCMRAHGIKDFPDPSNGGLQIRVSPGSDLDPHNPLFQSAQSACKHLMPGGAGP